MFSNTFWTTKGLARILACSQDWRLGWAILQVPITSDVTLEDPTITTPKTGSGCSDNTIMSADMGPTIGIGQSTSGSP